MNFITLALFFLAFFVNPAFTIVIICIEIAIATAELYTGYKVKKTDPFEWHKSVIFGSIRLLVCLWLLTIAFS